MFFALTLHPVGVSACSWSRKITGSSSNRTQQTAIENSQGFGSYEEKTNQKNKKKDKNILFFRLFFALTFLSFDRFPCSWSLKITGVALDFSRLRTRRNSEGFGSYEEKNKKKNNKNNKNIVFSIVFCSNFFVFHSILMFLVWKNHGRRQRLFEAKNTQKLQRVRKLWGKNKMKKTKKQKKRHFCFCFFAVTFLSFNRSPRSWSRKVTGSSSNRTQQTAIENSEGFGSY